MCDTMVALPGAGRDGQVYFAKNSDRQPNEPHLLIQVPHQHHPSGSKVRCTYIEIEQSPETYAAILLKPSWIWGCEMGGNEFGLNIGNEAVFTREKDGPPALTGMDMVRLALERCRHAREAVEFIIGLLEQYGQGGNCGYEKPFTYHNSFLIADPQEAWVLETAGAYWAAQKVDLVRSISNGLTIGSSFDRAHPQLVRHAVEKGWCKSEQDFHFARCYKDPLFTRYSGSYQRQACSQMELEAQRGNIGVQTMISILRSHHSETEGRQFARASLKSICMHAGGPIGDHTTGSYAASIGPNLCTYWITGASTPCLSMFKPAWLIPDSPVLYSEDRQEEALAFWKRREQFHRMVINGQIANLDEYFRERDRLETEWLEGADRLNRESAGSEEKREFMTQAWRQEEEVVDRYIRGNFARQVRRSGNLYYRHYWRRQNARLWADGGDRP